MWKTTHKPPDESWPPASISRNADLEMVHSVRKYQRHFGAGLVLVISFLSLLIPLSLYPFSIAADFPNHYAAFSIAFKQLQGGPPSSFYQVNWHLVPHLAMGLLAVPIALGMNIPLALHTFLLVSAVMPIVGTWAIHRQVHGKASWSLLLACSLFFNLSLFYGFLDFNFGLGLAFCLFAFLLQQTRKPTRLGNILLALGTSVLFLVHLLGFLIFGLLLLFQRIQLLLKNKGVRTRLTTLLCPLVWLTPTAILAAVWANGDLGNLPHEKFNFGIPDPAMVMRAVSGPFYFGDPGGAIVFIPLFLVLVPLAIRIRLLGTNREHLFTLGGLLVATVICSQRFGGVAMDFRLGLATFLFAVAVLKLEKMDTFLKRSIAITIGILLVSGLAIQWPTAWKNLRSTHQEVIAIREALKKLPLQSRLMVGCGDLKSRKFLHTGAFIALDRDGFFPQMFQVVQPVRARKKFAAINMPGKEMYGKRLVSGAWKKPEDVKNGSWFNMKGYYGWPSRFDFLIWFSTSEGPMLNFPFLEKISSGNHFFLYRINRQRALKWRRDMRLVYKQ